MKDLISLQEAHDIAVASGITVTIPTLINWVSKNDLGMQLSGKNGKWFVDRDKFDKFINWGNQDGENKHNSKANSEKKSKGRN